MSSEISYTKLGLLNCDECNHRSEDCLCDISNNDEDCPLLYKDKAHSVYYKKFIFRENRYVGFCVNCDNAVSSLDDFCSCCGVKLEWGES